MVPILLEHGHDLGEIQKRAAQTIYFVDHHAIHPSRTHGIQQAGQGGAVQAGAAEAAIIEWVARIRDVPNAVPLLISRKVSDLSDPCEHGLSGYLQIVIARVIENELLEESVFDVIQFIGKGEVTVKRIY